MQENRHYKDAINRGYYAAFYAVKAVLALGEVEFKRHKDAVAYFNQYFVATEVFPKEIGRPGLGVDIDEEAAAKYPCKNTVTTWTQTRKLDGSLQTP